MGQRQHFPDTVAVRMGCHPVLNHSVQGGLQSTGVGSCDSRAHCSTGLPFCLLESHSHSKGWPQTSQDPDSLTAKHTAQGLRGEADISGEEADITLTLAWDPGTLRMPSVSSPLFSRQDSNYQKEKSSLKLTAMDKWVQARYVCLS